MSEPNPTSLYRVTNNSLGDRVVYNYDRRPVTIPPKQAKHIRLDAGTAGRIVTHDSGLKVEQIEGDDSGDPGRQARRPATRQRERLTQPEQPKPVETTKNPKGEEVFVGDPRSAKELQAALKDKNAVYPKLVAEAKALLGDDWPGGVPNKSTLQGLLRKRAVADAKKAKED